MDFVGGEAVEFEGFVAGGVAAEEFDAGAGAIEEVGQHFDEGLVGGGVHGRGGDFDAEFVAEGFADFIGGGAGLEFHGQQGAIGLGAQVAGEGGHGGPYLSSGLMNLKVTAARAAPARSPTR